MRENVPDLIVIHHTADSWTGRQYEKINQYHKERWNFQSKLGSFMGYHFLIEKDGKVVQGRELDEEGAHMLGHNLRSIGVGFAGHFDYEYPTEQQLTAFYDLLGTIFADRRWSIKDIAFHKEFNATSCPGTHITNKLLLESFFKRARNIFSKILLWGQLLILKG